MRSPLRVLCPALLLASLAGCAAAPPEPVAAMPAAGAIAVACTESAISDSPCLAAARHDCPTAAVDTIPLLLAKQEGDKASYQYRATYVCPTKGSGTLVAAPQ
ncbi:hypothetical protein [Luteibacter yeojuensis]|uniref:Lipoprotein n=1 Tax=Luteibacter yeojuensis TaxID=345309 RepID=A0A0F3KZ20_9GAMM|nr:hypothetical protein [Luteibacter yeojuensis]KJV36530.1 hypothetical protein VI08_04065 [Luteibacter yeojuensis]